MEAEAVRIILAFLQLAPAALDDALKLKALWDSADAAMKSGTVTADEWLAVRQGEAADEAVVNAPIVDSSNV